MDDYLYNIFVYQCAEGIKTQRQHHLLCHSRELENVESLVVRGGTLVDVDDHTGFSSTTEKALQVVGQLALPEGNMLKQSAGGIYAHH